MSQVSQWDSDKLLCDATAKMALEPANILCWVTLCYHCRLRAHKSAVFGKIWGSGICKHLLRTDEDNEKWCLNKRLGVKSLTWMGSFHQCPEFVSRSTLFTMAGCCILTSSGALCGFTRLICPFLSSGSLGLKATEIPEDWEGNSGTWAGQDLKLGFISVILVVCGDLGGQYQNCLSLWICE